MRPADGAESTDIPDARWTDNIPILLQEKFLQSFENAGYSQAVSRPRDGFEAAYQLVLDIRSFSLVTGAEPTGELEFEAKILGPGGKIIAAKSFHTTAPATGTDAPAAAAALNQAFAKAATELVPWAVEAIKNAPPGAAAPRSRRCHPNPRRLPRARPCRRNPHRRRRSPQARPLPVMDATLRGVRRRAVLL